ncbi:MAG: hypothetical protein Kow0099_26710 [Candidatus Abyssubacteria bacterium]
MVGHDNEIGFGILFNKTSEMKVNVFESLFQVGKALHFVIEVVGGLIVDCEDIDIVFIDQFEREFGLPVIV